MSDFDTNIGKIVIGLAERCTYVRVDTVDSVMTKGLYRFRIYKVREKETRSHEEMFNREMIEQIADPMVIVDALINKLDRAQNTGVKVR